jgi:hypothetical protein
MPGKRGPIYTRVPGRTGSEEWKPLVLNLPIITVRAILEDTLDEAKAVEDWPVVCQIGQALAQLQEYDKVDIRLLVEDEA